MRGPQILAVTFITALVGAGCSDGVPTVTQKAVAADHGHPSMNLVASGDPSVPGGVSVRLLARGNFLDNIDATFKIQLDRATNVVHVRDPSDAVVAQLTFAPGGSVGWHTHHGPAIVTVASGALSIINKSDCVRRTYAAGNAFVDPGQGNIHVGFNETGGETIVYVTFLGVPAGQGPTIAAEPGCAL